MRIFQLGGLVAGVAATILQNGQEREDPYPGQAEKISLDDTWRSYDAGAPEIAYKGRWDSKHISCRSNGVKEEREDHANYGRVVVRCPISPVYLGVIANTDQSTGHEAGVFWEAGMRVFGQSVWTRERPTN